jgi:hypothetical protein
VPPPSAPTTLAAATLLPAAATNKSTTPGEAQLLDNWLAIQGINLVRHARSLRRFRDGEFGTGPAAPTDSHIEAANRFIERLRTPVAEASRWVDAAASAARRDPSAERLTTLLERKQSVSNRVLYVEGIWDFFYDLFVQRLSSFAERLHSVDRIASNCYEDVYTGLGNAQPPPNLLPFSYASSGFSPSTYRRGVPLQRLRNLPNVFPLVLLPQHRLDAPWALSSALHETAHNLQADLGLWGVMPGRVFQRLTREGGLPESVARVWARWHKETMADLMALILGGPAAVESLMDVVARRRSGTVLYAPGVHPTSVLRVPLSLTLLRRLGFRKMADDVARLWKRLYPAVGPESIPPEILRTFDRAAELVVDTMVFTPYPQMAGKAFVQVVPCGPGVQGQIEAAGRRLAAGGDLGPVPSRYLIGAARFALDQRLATPQAITDNFYRLIGRR